MQCREERGGVPRDNNQILTDVTDSQLSSQPTVGHNGVRIDPPGLWHHLDLTLRDVHFHPPLSQVQKNGIFGNKS